LTATEVIEIYNGLLEMADRPTVNNSYDWPNITHEIAGISRNARKIWIFARHLERHGAISTH